jgi:hypothetical protein
MTSCVLLLIAGAACGFAQPVTVGYLVDSGELLPAGTYANGKWMKPDVKAMPFEWKLWNPEFHGSTVLTKPHSTPADDSPYRPGWDTGFPKKAGKADDSAGKRLDSDEAFGLATVGLVTSREVRVILFRDQTANISEQNRVRAFLGRRIKLTVDRVVQANESGTGYTRIVLDERPLIKRSEAAVDGQTYYHVSSINKVYNQDCHFQHAECGYFTVNFEAWFTESQAGLRNLVSSSAPTGSEDGAGSTFINPEGLIVVDGQLFAVARGYCYECGLGAAVLSLGPHSVQVLLRTAWDFL